MSNANLKRWISKFRKDARTDQHTLFRKHLRDLALPDDPELLTEGTIQVVIASAAYASLDGQSFATFLNMQRYDPAEAIDAKYAFTFDLCGKASARILVPTKAIIPDLADLYGHQWEDYKVCGYRSMYISRIDQRKMGRREIARLERDVTNDLRFDYGEEELDLWFNDQSIEGVLQAFVQDHEAGED